MLKVSNGPPDRGSSNATNSTNGSSNVSQSKLTHSNVSMHVGTHGDPENQSMIWNWVGRHLTAPLSILPGLRQNTTSSLQDDHSTHHTSMATGSHAPGTPMSGLGDRTPLQPQRSNNQRARRAAVPVSEGVVRGHAHGSEFAEFSDDEIATLLEGGVMHDGGQSRGKVSALGLCDLPEGLRRRGNVGTDLRLHAAAQRLGASLRNTEHAAPPIIEGEEGQEVWRNIMARATIPRQLQEELCRWADHEGLLHKRGQFPGKVSGSARRRTSSAGAVAESRVQGTGSAHMEGGGDVDPPSQNISRAGPHVGARNGNNHDNGRERPKGEDLAVPQLKMEVLEDADIEDDGCVPAAPSCMMWCHGCSFVHALCL